MIAACHVRGIRLFNHASPEKNVQDNRISLLMSENICIAYIDVKMSFLNAM